MYHLLVLFMLVAALEQFGMKVSAFAHCRSRACLIEIEKRSRDVLQINWKSISVFPDEAKRFKVKIK